jgi:hypothetical protein
VLALRYSISEEKTIESNQGISYVIEMMMTLQKCIIIFSLTLKKNMNELSKDFVSKIAVHLMRLN